MIKIFFTDFFLPKDRPLLLDFGNDTHFANNVVNTKNDTEWVEKFLLDEEMLSTVFAEIKKTLDSKPNLKIVFLGSFLPVRRSDIMEHMERYSRGVIEINLKFGHPY